MFNQADFTPEEWEAITSLPVKAGILIMWSHETNPLEFLSEVSTLTATVVDATDSKDELVRAVAQVHQERNEEFRVEAPDSREAAEQFRIAVLEQCRTVHTILMGKSLPDRGMVYKQWVVGVARRVAEAAKEGGFLSFFSGDVSEHEREVIEQINNALGLPKH